MPVLEVIGDEVIWTFLALLTALLLVSFWPSQHGHDGTEQERERDVTQRPSYFSELCPVCLGEIRYHTETICGHAYCAPCIRQCVLQIGYKDEGTPCPLCRRNVTMLFPMFTPEETELQEGRLALGFIRRYNTLYTHIADNPSSILRDWPGLMRYMFRDLFALRRLMTLIKFRIIMLVVFGIIYVFMPVDILPETVYGLFGFLDDLIVITILIVYLSMIYRNFLLRQIRE